VGPTEQSEPVTVGFESFADDAGMRLRRALVARYGPDVGVEAAADAIAYAWQHWDRVSDMDNAVGYLYRVAQTTARRHRRWGRGVTLPPERLQPDVADDSPTTSSDIRLPRALARLRPDERVAVVLVHGYAWSYQEVADLLGVPTSTVRNHVHRGLTRLRTSLEI
jgi:RNA polymerase sigma-70 factor (ECF subfamily)